MKNKAASAVTTMKNTDPKAETVVISLDVSPKITHKPWKETDYSSKINHNASELDCDYYTTYILAGQIKENASEYVNIINVTSTPNRVIYIPCVVKIKYQFN